jgi:hypothetical protein
LGVIAEVISLTSFNIMPASTFALLSLSGLVLGMIGFVSAITRISRKENKNLMLDVIAIILSIATVALSVYFLLIVDSTGPL